MPDLLLPVLRAQIHSEPLQEQLRTGDIATGLTSCFLCPPAWRWASPHLFNMVNKHTGLIIFWVLSLQSTLSDDSTSPKKNFFNYESFAYFIIFQESRVEGLST